MGPAQDLHNSARDPQTWNFRSAVLVAVLLVGLVMGSSVAPIDLRASPTAFRLSGYAPRLGSNGGAASPGVGTAPNYEGLYSVAKTLALDNNTVYPGRQPVAMDPADPQEVAYDPATNSAYVLQLPSLGAFTRGGLSVINLTLGRTITSIHLPGAPVAIVYDPADQTIVIASQVDPLLIVVNTSSNQIQAEIAMASPPASLAYIPSFDELVVGSGSLVEGENYSAGALTVYNATTLLPVVSVPTVYPATSELWVPPGTSNYTGLLYVLETPGEGGSSISGTSLVGVFSPSNESFTATLSMPPPPYLDTPAGNLTCGNPAKGYVISASLPPPIFPSGALGLDPVRSLLYVAPVSPQPCLSIFDHDLNQLVAVSLANLSHIWTVATTSTGNWNQPNSASALFMGLIPSIQFDPGINQTLFAATGNESLNNGAGYLFEWNLNASNASSLRSTHTWQTIPGGVGALLSGPPGQLLLTNPVQDTLEVLNSTTSATQASISIGTTPLGAVFDPVSGSVYVCEEYQDAVAVIDPVTMTIVGTIPVGGGPVAIAVDPVTGELAVANSFTGNLSLISATTDRVIATVATGGAPIGVTYDPWGTTWLVTNNRAPYLSVIAAEGLRLSARVMLPGGGPSYAAVVDEATRQIYVSQLTESNVTVLNATTYRLEGVIGVGRGPMLEAVVPNQGEVVVSSVDSGILSVINASRMKVEQNLTFAYPPTGMLDDPVTGLLLITEPEINVLGVLDPGRNFAQFPTLGVGASPWGLALVPSTGTVEVTNSAAGTVMEAVPYGLTVTVTETGLPAHTPWWINVSSIGSWETATSTLSFELVNGTYGYTVGTTDRARHSGGGFFVLAGASIQVSVVFVPYLSEVTWVESGLPGGLHWWVTINGTMEGNGTTGRSISLELGNGTYAYGVGTDDSRWAASGGGLEVNGSSETIFVRFQSVQYGWVVTETGLPKGTAWAVELEGRSYPGVGNAVTLNLTNGSYRYALVSGNLSYHGRGGTIVVAGRSGSVEVIFAPTLYRVEFEESGLANGTPWTVTIAGQREVSRNGTIEVWLGNGSYGYTVGDTAGLAALPSSGQLVVSGGDIPTVVVSFVASGGVAWYLWAAGGGGVALTGLALAVFVHRRHGLPRRVR